MADLATILEQINQRISGDALARLLDYHTDKIQNIKDTVRCFCPVHRELAFRSLILYDEQKTYKCTMKRCACFEGGSFVELWALHRGTEPVQAALELVERLELDVDTQLLSRLGQDYVAEAREALTVGDLARARERLNDAMALDPGSVELHLLSASVYEREGEPERAFEERLRVVDAYSRSQALREAEELLDELLEQEPARIELLTRRGELARQTGPTEKLVDALEQLAAVYLKRGKTAEALGAIEEARRADPDNVALLEKLGQFYQSAGQLDRLEEVLGELTERYEGAEDHDSLMRVLEKRSALHPEKPAIREHIARTLEAIGRGDEARERWLGLVDEYVSINQLGKARAILDGMVQREPECVALIEKQADLLHRAGDADAATQCYRRLIRLAREEGRHEEVGRLFELACSLSPDEIDLWTEHAEWRLDTGDTEGAIREMFKLADACLEAQRREQGMELLERIARLAATDVDKRLRVGRCFERNGLTDEAFATYTGLAGDLLREQRFDPAQAVCEEARRLRPMAEEVDDLRIRTAQGLGHTAEAVEVCRERARQLVDMVDVDSVDAGPDPLDRAMRTLSRAIELAPDDTEARTDLARLLEREDRGREAAELWLEVAMLHRGRGAATVANEAIREALRLNPADEQAQVRLAEALEAEGRTVEAARVWKQLGRARICAGDSSDEGLSRLERALELTPDDLELLAEVSGETCARRGEEPAQPLFERWLRLAESTGDRGACMTAYRAAVERYPHQLAWRERLAQLLELAGEHQDAAAHLEALLESMTVADPTETRTNKRHALLERLLTLQPDRLDLQRRVGESLVEQGRRGEAVAVLRRLAGSHLEGGELDTAIEILQQALELNPNNEDLLSETIDRLDQAGRLAEAAPLLERLAEVYRRQTDPTRNIPVLERLIGLNPDRGDLRTELAELYEREGDVDRAVELLMSLARECAERDADTGRAIVLCLRIRALAPHFVESREMLVDAWLAQGSVGEAKEELDRLGDLALERGDSARAEACFRRIREIDPGDLGSGERLGKLYEAAGRRQDAAATYRDVLALYEQSDDAARCQSVLQKLKRLEADDPSHRLRLARLLLEAGERREAGEEWLGLIELAVRLRDDDLRLNVMAEAMANFGDDWAWRQRACRALTDGEMQAAAADGYAQLATDALDAGELQAARDAAGNGLELAPQDEALRELRVEICRRLSDFPHAIADLRVLADAHADTQDFEAATGFIQRALELDPQSIELLEALLHAQRAAGRIEGAAETLRRLAQHCRQQEELDLAISWAHQLVELVPEDVEARDYLAGLFVSAERVDEAVATWREMVEMLAAGGQVDAAIARCKRILEYIPGNIDVLRRMADLTYEQAGMHEAGPHYDRLLTALQAEGDAVRIEEEYRRILELEPGHLDVKERFADYLFDQSRMDEAREILMEIAQSYRDEREAPEEALRMLRRIKALAPEELEVRESEAGLLEYMERNEEAGQVWRQVAALHRRAGNLEQTANCLVRCAELQDDQPQVQIETAEVFHELGDDERATEHLLRAIAIHDHLEQLEQAVPVLERAIEWSPDRRRDLPDALARIHERLGRFDQAARVWLELGDRLEREEASEEAFGIYVHLREVAPHDGECRRRLARIYEQRGEPANMLAEYRELAALASAEGALHEAAEYLQIIRRRDPRDVDSLAALADIWREADRADDLYDTLCDLEQGYRQDGRYPEALGVLSELKALQPDEPDLLKRSIELLVRTGQIGHAAQQGFDLIQICFDRNEDAQALEALRYVSDIEPENIERRISLARLVHLNGREEAALQEFILTASVLFGEAPRAGDDDGESERLELSEAAPDEAATRRFESVLHVCEAGLQLFSDDVRLRDLMGRAQFRLGRLAEAIETQLHLAAVYDERGEEQKARRVYETILAEQPDNQATLEAMIEWALRHEKTGCAVDHLLTLAENHYVNGELDAAISAMERIQELDDSRLDLKGRLAQIHLEAGDAPRARTALLETAEGWLARERPETAIEIYQQLLGLDGNDVEALAALVRAYEDLGRGEDHLREAIRLGDLHCIQGRVGDALAVFEQLSEAHPNRLEVWEALARAYRETSSIDGAVAALKRCYELNMTSRRPEQAREALESALSLRPNDVGLVESLGDLCMTLGRRAEGLGHLSRAADLAFEAEELDQAARLAERILKLDPVNLPVRQRLADIRERAGDTAAAVAELTEIARGYAEARDGQAALAVLDHLLELDPERVEERELYAKLLHRAGQIEESIDQYVTLLESPEVLEDPRRTIRYCRQILAERPDHSRAHECLCEVYEQTDKPRQAFKECEWLVGYYLAKDALQQAEAYYRKALNWVPEDLGMRQGLVDLLIRLERRGEAAEQVHEMARLAAARSDEKITIWAMEKACELDPENIDSLRRLAEYHESQGRQDLARENRLRLVRLLLNRALMDEAREMADRVVEAVTEDQQIRVEVARLFEEAGLPEVSAYHYHHLARRALEAGQLVEARGQAQHALTLKPHHVGARETLIEILLGLQDTKGAVEQYERLAEIYMEAGDFDHAQRTLARLIDLVPSQAGPRRKLIAIHRQLHRIDLMVEQLHKLVEILINNDQLSEALECLREVMNDRPEDTWARMRYIDLYAQIGDESDLDSDYLHLARIFANKGSVVEATRCYEKLMQLKREDAECREEFVQFLFEQGQVNRAIEETRGLAGLHEAAGAHQEAIHVIDRALNYAPQELDLRLRLADLYRETNRRGLALETYRSLSRQYDQAGDEENLIAVTERIVQIDTLNVEYRQRLADLHHRAGNIDEALRHYGVLAEAYVERGLFDLAEHQYRLMLDIQPGDTELMRRIVETHMKTGSPHEVVGDMIGLAETLNREGRINQCVEVYRQVLACQPDNLEVLTSYVETYSQIGPEEDLFDDYLHLADLRIGNGDVAEAVRIYRHLLEVCPNNQLVQDRLTATQTLMSRRKRGEAASAAKETGAPPPPPPPPPPPVMPRSGTGPGPNGSGSGTGSGTGPRDEILTPERLNQTIRNYENVLRLNPKNPTVHAKLAELLQRAGDTDRADSHWRQAAEHSLGKGDIERCIAICEQLMTRHPEDTQIRDTLSRAKVQRDSLKAIDGVLSAQVDDL